MSSLPNKNFSIPEKLQYGLFFLLVFSGFIPKSNAQDLLLFPHRIVFEGTQNRVQTINLTNTGTDTTTFKISFTNTRMKPDGSIETITEPDPDQRFAEPFLRVFPKTVTIAPNKSQLVKIQLIKTSEMETGEYRSHLYFRPVPKVEQKQSLEVKEDSELLEIKITPIYGYAIANLIKIGESTTKVSITDLSLTRKGEQPLFSLQLHRLGNMSSYGDITVYHISPEGKETQVAVQNGVAVYAPGTLRKASIGLSQDKGVDYSSGSLRVTYTSGKGTEILAEARLEL